jgi:hypothetical protein
MSKHHPKEKEVSQGPNESRIDASMLLMMKVPSRTKTPR